MLYCVTFSILFFFFSCPPSHLDLHSFPTRRSSDLVAPPTSGVGLVPGLAGPKFPDHASLPDRVEGSGHVRPPGPRSKSTRLNSSHVSISYAVFCLKKKKKT